MPKRVLITGASSGLGEALAREHARLGHSLVLVARRAARLRALAAECRALGAPRALVCVGDVARRAVLLKAARLARSKLGGLDVAYANAGYAQGGALATMPPARLRRQLAVNLEGALHTVQACLPLLKAGDGRLGLVGSVVAYGSLAGSGAYAASKAALRGLAQVLDLELRPLGVSVTFIAPGFFASEIRLKDPDGRPEPRNQEYLPSWLVGDPARLAHLSRRAVEAGKRELVWPLHAKLAVWLIRLAPGLAQALARRLSRLREARKRAARKS